VTEVAITPRSFRDTPGAHHDLLQEYGIEWRFPDLDRPLNAAEMIAFVEGCAGLIVGTDAVTEGVLAAGPLRAVVKFGSGMDNIDLAAAERRSVLLDSTPGANARSVAELAIGLMLAVARSIPAHDRKVRAGEWSRRTGVELRGKTLGLVGYGAIGREVAVIAEGLGMDVLVHDPHAEVDRAEGSLREVLSGADVVSLHLPLSHETRNLIGRPELAELKDDAILVNTARGGVVDEAALALELASGRLRGAAFDSFATEPPESSPLVHLDAFVGSPHAGAATAEAAQRAGVAAIEQLMNLLGEGSQV
jgi:D-3-phosphoglycerate dehydrogenase / 2-oxoglutarate reductase